MTPDDLKQHIEELYSYASPRITNPHELDEVLASTFSNALKAGHQEARSQDGDSAECDSAWLIGILRTQIRSHYREKYSSEEAIAKARQFAKKVLDVPFNTPQQLSSLGSNLLSQSDNQAFWDAFKECVEMLNEVHADVFILRDLENISVEELSGIFSLKRSDVLDLIYRARMLVIACLVKSMNPDR